MYKYGSMALSMMGIGSEIRLTAMGGLYMQMVMFMKENGLMIKQKDKGHTLIWMVLSIKVNGKLINNMAKVLRHGLMEHNMLEVMLRVRNMEKEGLNGQMGVNSKEIL